MIKLKQIAFSLFSLLCLGVIHTQLQAQVFTHKAKIEPVSKSGYYQIPLNSNITSRGQMYLQDLRLFDALGKEVPYLLKKETPYQNNENYVSLNLLSNSSNENAQTLIVENDEKKTLNCLIFDIQNAETERSLRISVSNDQKQWFSISDSMDFVLWGMANETVQRKSIRFPASNYRYFKIEIKRKNKELLNIIQVGYSSETSKITRYVRIDNMRYTVKEVGSKTHIAINMQGKNTIDQLQFYIREPQFYQRNVLVSTSNNIEKQYSIRRKSYDNQENKIKFNMVLSSDNKGSINTHDYLGNFHKSHIDIEIENNNNQPLLIDSLVAFQLSASIIAELKAGKPYFLYVGDSNLNAPVYDLRFFESKIPANLPMAKVGSIQGKEQKIAGEYDGKNERNLMWAGMGILAVFLIFITMNLMKKMG